MSFADLPAEAFPVEITGIGPDGAVVWERTVHPYQVTEIPATPPELVGKLSVRVKYATGDVVWQRQGSREEAQAHIERRLRESDEGQGAEVHGCREA